MKSGWSRKQYLRSIYVLILLSGLFVSPNSVLSSDASVRINEIFYDALGSDAKKEWIEIYNSSDTEASLEGWKFFEGGVDHTLRPHENDESLLPGGYGVIADNSATFLEAYPSYAGVLFDSSFSLSNVGEVLSIKDDEGQIKYTVDYKEYIEEGVSGYALELNDEGEWKKSCVLGGSPGTKNCIEYQQIIFPTDIRFNEVYPDPDDSPESQYEFIELYNFGAEVIDLSNWKVRDRTGEKDVSGTIDPGEYIALYKTVSLNNGGDEIALLDPNGKQVDVMEYTDSKEGWSWSRDDAQWDLTPYRTPSKENVFIVNTTSEHVHLNEIHANPEGDEEDEFIELYNNGTAPVDMQWWSVGDASQSGVFIFDTEEVILPGEFLVIYRSEYLFALNNAEEEVRLMDPEGNVLDSFSYTKTKEGASFNYNGSKWRASKNITPGKKNIFNDLPEISKAHIDKKVYEDVWAYFTVSTKDLNNEKVKVKWEFGDGKKSYKKETRHKYKKRGKYAVTLTVSDESEDVVKEFDIEVKKYPKVKMKIRSFSPNPSGKDSEYEWIRLVNYSSKDIDLKGWSIATGTSSKKITNHPIYDEIKVEEGDEYILTREDSKFSLNNKKGRIELRYPNGDVAYKIKYKKEQGISDDEIYIKHEGGSWQWELSGSSEREVESVNDPFDMKGIEPMSRELIGKRSMDVENQRTRMSLLGLQALPEDVQGSLIVAPKRKIQKQGEVYVFIESSVKDDHYVVRYIKNLTRSTNNIIGKIYR